MPDAKHWPAIFLMNCYDMSESLAKEKKNSFHWPMPKHAKLIAIIGAVCVFIGLVVVGGGMVLAKQYEGKIVPGVRIFDIDVSGLTKREAHDRVEKAIHERLAKGVNVKFRDQEAFLTLLKEDNPFSEARVGTMDDEIDTPQWNTEFIGYEGFTRRDPSQKNENMVGIAPVVEKAYQVGRGQNWLETAFRRLILRVHPKTLLPAINSFDESAPSWKVSHLFRKQLFGFQNAAFSIVAASGTEPLVHIEPEKYGVAFDEKQLIDRVREAAERLEFKPIELKEVQSKPELFAKDLEPFTEKALTFIRGGSLQISFNGKKNLVPTSTLAEWMLVEKNQENAWSLGVSQAKTGEYLNGLFPDIKREAKDGNLVLNSGVGTSTVKTFDSPVEGRAFDVARLVNEIEMQWPATTTFAVETIKTSGRILGDAEQLGIREVIAVGASNFSGSPTNRRKNIKKGAEKVHGTLLAPGEEFSLLRQLGSIDGVNGWLPELVIKGNQTVPEFGGGLCQIGTTVFRGAFNSGLKITQRTNHSYRVRYYEPAGTDATIYEPSPDFRFVNDTPHHILINARLEGDDAIFEFWGTKDGRVVDPMKPRIFGITAPPPTKFIETLELAPGQKRCTESAHAGAQAELPYKITYADGSIHQEVFKSIYRPWQAVCLVGVAQLSEPAPADVNQPLEN